MSSKKTKDSGPLGDMQYRLLFQSNPQPMWVYDLETLTFLAVNDAAIATYGYTEPEFLSMTIKDIRPKEDIPALLENIAHVTEGLDNAGVWRHKKKDGSIISVEISSHTLQIAGRKAELVIAIDVTKHMISEKSRSLLQQAIQDSHDVVFITTKDGTINYINSAFTSLYGYTPEEAIGKNPRILKSGKHTPDEYKKFYETLHAGKTVHRETINRAKDGRLLTIETTVDPIFNANGESEGFIAIQRDITVRKQMEEKLAESELRLSQITETIPHVFWVTDPQKQEILYVSPAYEKIWERSINELYHSPHSWVETIHQDDRDRVQQAALTKQAAGTYDEMYRIVRLDGSIRWIRERAYPVKNENGEVYRITGLATDITEFKAAEMALLESEAKFRTLAQTSPAAIFVYGPKFTYVNHAAQALTGYNSEEMLAMNFWEIVHPDHRDLVRQRGENRLRGEHVPNRYEFKILRKDGESRWIDFSAGAFKPNGKTYAIGTASDITERKAIEEQLRNSERLYKDLVENSNDVTYLLDRHLRLVYVSPVIEQKTGYAPNELLGRKFADIIHPADVETTKKQFRTAVNGGTMEPVEFRFKTKSGKVLWARASVIPVMKAEKLESIRGTAIDITEQKLAIESLRASEERFRTLIETASSAIIIYQGEYLHYANKAAEHLLGYSRKELFSMKFWEIAHPDEQENVRQRGMTRQHRENVPSKIEVRVVTKAGNIRWVDFTAAMIEYEGQPAVLGTAFDITNRKQAEEAIQQQLNELQRWYKTAQGRETRILELKSEVNALLQRAGDAPKYKSVLQAQTLNNPQTTQEYQR